MKSHKGIEYDNSETVLLIRTTERPKYLEQTFFKTVSTCSEDCKVFVISNCRDQGIQELNRTILTRDIDREHLFVEYDYLLGVPGSINEGVKVIKRRWPEAKRVIVCDDDAFPAEPKIVDGKEMCWDEAISIMLGAGWKIAGHASRLTWYSDTSRKVIGGIEGHAYDHVAGAFAGFSIASWENSGGVPSLDRLFGFGPFCHKFRGYVGYWANPPFMVTDLDRDTHPKSLRRKEYFQWYKMMRPTKAREFESEVEDRWK